MKRSSKHHGILRQAKLALAMGVLLTAGRAAAVEATGPLRAHPTNGRYFTDGSGKAVYLAGAHTWNELYDARGPLDYSAYLNFLVQHNHNFTKFRAWDSTLLYKPMYYKRTGHGTASDGLPKVDLNQFDQAHFDRMRERLIAARDKGIYVMIMLFTTEELNGDPAFSNPTGTGSWDRTARCRWSFHPYNKLNNLNGIDGGNRDNSAPAKTETLSYPGITSLREAYIRKVIDTVNSSAEGIGPGGAKAWQENHFFAYAIKKHLLAWLDPKPPAYRNDNESRIHFKGYLPG